MPAVVRIGDTSSHGGSMVSASAQYTADGKQVCVSGDSHSCPIPGHGVTPVTGTGKVTSGGKNTVKVGDSAGCGATITQGSSTVTTA